MKPRDEIQRLRDEIRRHDHLYYVRDKPEVSDRDYDRLFQRLKELEAEHPELRTPDSPTQRVSERPLDGFAHVTHAVPMLSIDNTYNEAELRAFDGRVAKGLGGEAYEYLVDPKVDGVSATLRYEEGLLVLAATRGDGRTGDDVTANIRTIRSVPLRLSPPYKGGAGGVSSRAALEIPRLLEIRGEVYWPRADFDRFNAERQKRGEEVFANPRNATSGTLKQLDAKLVAPRGLAFVAHGCGVVEPMRFERASEFFDALAAWGVPVNPHRKLCRNIDEVVRFVQEWDARRHDLEYETDGLVIKVDQLHQRDALGATSRFPRWCIAYKYAAEQAETVLLTVEPQVGKLGTITPRAVMEPVLLSGTTVRHATLHNYDQVERLGEGHNGLHIGDSVIVEKAGEIIPQVIRIVREGKPRGERVVPPGECPKCKGNVIADEGGVYIRCNNPACPAQIKERLKHFCGRDQMDIEGVGDALVDLLVETTVSNKPLVSQFADLYNLHKHRDKLVNLAFEQVRDTDDGGKKIVRVKLGEKRMSALLAGIENSKQRPLARLLAALNIRHVGASTAELLANHLGSIEGKSDAELRKLEELTSVEALQEIEGVGPEVANSIHQFFGSTSGRSTIKHLAQAGVEMIQPKREASGAQPLAGMTVVPTGSFERFSRQEINEAIKAAGGKPGGSVSKKTSFVVAGQDAGSKLDKARELGVEVIDEAEFARRIAGT